MRKMSIKFGGIAGPAGKIRGSEKKAPETGGFF
jgi:hypothetical protein